MTFNRFILKPEVQAYITENSFTDSAKIALKGSVFNEVSARELAQQIESKQRCKTKLPLWYITPNIYYPGKLNIEQTSSELAAQFKAQLFPKGLHILDLTGGLGVDSYYFAKQAHSLVHIEQDKTLSAIAAHNFKQLGSTNITIQNTDGVDFVINNNNTYDLIYADPARRDNTEYKHINLNRYEPNVVKHLNVLLEKTKQLVIKTSPLLDIQTGLKELIHVDVIYIVAIRNDVKELLWFVTKIKPGNSPKIRAINIQDLKNFDAFEFNLEDETCAQPNFSLPQTFLYEPNSAILKSGAFKLLSERLKVNKLHLHSHLYTSDKHIDFPGRCFRIVSVTAFSKKAVKQLKLTKANISTRNFPMSVARIKQTFNIKDGGHLYCFFTTNCNNKKIVICCEKVKPTV